MRKALRMAKVGMAAVWTGVALSLLVLPAVSHAVPAKLKVQGRFRDAPRAQSNVLEVLPAGSIVEVIEILPNHWRRVSLPDGRTGYVWKDHFALDEVVAAPDAQPEAAPEATAPAVVPAATEPVAAQPTAGAPAAVPASPPSPPPAPGAPASAEEVAHLRDEVRRLSAAYEELTARIDKAPGAASTSPLTQPLGGTPIDGTAGAAALFMVVGAVICWILMRIVRRRRDRRPKIRL